MNQSYGRVFGSLVSITCILVAARSLSFIDSRPDGVVRLCGSSTNIAGSGGRRGEFGTITDVERGLKIEFSSFFGVSDDTIFIRNVASGRCVRSVLGLASRRSRFGGE